MDAKRKKEFLILGGLVGGVILLAWWLRSRKSASIAVNGAGQPAMTGQLTYNIPGTGMPNFGDVTFPAVNSGGAGSCGGCSGNQFRTPQQIAASLDNSSYYDALQQELDSLALNINSGQVGNGTSFNIPQISTGDISAPLSA